MLVWLTVGMATAPVLKPKHQVRATGSRVMVGLTRNTVRLAALLQSMNGNGRGFPGLTGAFRACVHTALQAEQEEEERFVQLQMMGK